MEGYDKDALPDNLLPEMTSVLFFRCCQMGYAANHYEGSDTLSPKELYRKYADMRDEGLLDIDENSPKAFAHWLKHRPGGGHPWEVCRGGNSTHVSLFVRKEDAGFYFDVAGKSWGRSIETIKFFLAIHYEEARSELFNHFKTIAGLDAAVLESIGVHKKKVKEALKMRFSGLKALYWKAAFDCLEEITSRLTSTSRRNMLERFAILKSVDFTPSNLYAMIVWVIKNYNKFTEQQMIDLFCALSCPANVQNYASNKRVFEEFHSRWGEKPRSTHYTLDYRIVCTEYALPGEGWHSSYEPRVRDSCQRKIEDVCAVAFSLGFKTGFIQMPETWGKRGTVYMDDYKTVLFAFRCYLNNNVHIKFNIELMKALNVAVALKLGWIRKPSDIAQEFPPEMAKGAERYFDCFRLLDVSKVQMLLCSLPEATDDCSGEEQEEIPLPLSV